MDAFDYDDGRWGVVLLGLIGLVGIITITAVYAVGPAYMVWPLIGGPVLAGIAAMAIIN